MLRNFRHIFAVTNFEYCSHLFNPTLKNNDFDPSKSSNRITTNVKINASSKYPISHPFILIPRRLRCCHFKNCASQAPYINRKTIAICMHYNLRKQTSGYRGREKQKKNREGCACFKRNFKIWKRGKIFTSGAIQYGLPLKESTEAEAFIWFRTAIIQR